MAWQIQISRAKPNPKGKDTNQNGPLESQLLGEWVDLKNIGNASVRLDQLHLAHSTYSHSCIIKERVVIYWNGSSTQSLGPDQAVRVHTGNSKFSSMMNYEDSSGVHLHAFAERGSFVLNNDCGDELTVWWKKGTDTWNEDDHAKYGPRPDEGKILVRVDDKLI